MEAVDRVGDLLAVDPAINSPGAALFRGGQLVAAARVKIDRSYAKLPIADRVCRVAADVVRWAMTYQAKPRFLVVEWPQIYKATHQKGSKKKADVNDLLALAGVCGALSGILTVAMVGCSSALTVVSRTPAEWAGQLPKATTGDAKLSPRAHRILSRLTPDERAIVPDSHDALDAIGLGLHALGRFERHRVMPRGVIALPDPADVDGD